MAPGLVWLATLFSLLLLVQRTFAVEAEDGALDALRAAGVDAAAIFWGKALALAAQLAVLEACCSSRRSCSTAAECAGRGRAAGHDLARRDRGLAAVGTLYGGLAAGHGGGRPSSRCCCSRWWRPF